MSKYPLILVHGFMGWGEDDKLTKICRYWGTFGKTYQNILENKVMKYLYHLSVHSRAHGIALVNFMLTSTVEQ